MARTNEDAVKGIVEVDGSIDLQPFIDTANSLVTDVCAPAANKLSDAQLELIERWLAAHFYCIIDPQTVREEVSTLRTVYQQQVGYGLDQTRYGQQAKLLDTSGALAAYDNSLKKTRKRNVSVKWVGSQTNDYNPE